MPQSKSCLEVSATVYDKLCLYVYLCEGNFFFSNCFDFSAWIAHNCGIISKVVVSVCFCTIFCYKFVRRMKNKWQQYQKTKKKKYRQTTQNKLSYFLRHCSRNCYENLAWRRKVGNVNFVERFFSNSHTMKIMLSLSFFATHLYKFLFLCIQPQPFIRLPLWRTNNFEVI